MLQLKLKIKQLLNEMSNGHLKLDSQVDRTMTVHHVFAYSYS